MEGQGFAATPDSYGNLVPASQVEANVHDIGWTADRHVANLYQHVTHTQSALSGRRIGSQFGDLGVNALVIHQFW